MKTLKRSLTIILLIFTLFLLIPQANASSATSYTLTINAKGQMVRTQDAYLPLRTTMELNLKNPEDMIFDDEGYLWIADTGNKRILKYDSISNTLVDRSEEHTSELQSRE